MTWTRDAWKTMDIDILAILDILDNLDNLDN